MVNARLKMCFNVSIKRHSDLMYKATVDLETVIALPKRLRWLCEKIETAYNTKKIKTARDSTNIFWSKFLVSMNYVSFMGPELY